MAKQTSKTKKFILLSPTMGMQSKTVGKNTHFMETSCSTKFRGYNFRKKKKKSHSTDITYQGNTFHNSEQQHFSHEYVEYNPLRSQIFPCKVSDCPFLLSQNLLPLHCCGPCSLHIPAMWTKTIMTELP